MLISKIKRSLSHRIKTGNFSTKIDDLKQIQAHIKRLAPAEGDRAYLEWYAGYVDFCIKRLRLARVFPTSIRSVLEGRGFERPIAPLINDNIARLKEIKLSAEKQHPWTHHQQMLRDSILTYLLSSLGEEDLYPLFGGVFSEGPYEYKSIKLEKGDIVIDAGACIGEFSALAGIKGCRAYAFEPTPSVVDNFLAKTAKLNPNITICKYALSDKKGELAFYQSYISSTVLRRGVGPTSGSIKVNAIDLDSFVHENNLERVDFIKADIEGSERYMLMGAKQVLRQYAPKLSICKYHLPDDPKVLCELILDANPNYIIEERWKKIYAYVPK
jgi:FkbM family methyltransferase